MNNGVTVALTGLQIGTGIVVVGDGLALGRSEGNGLGWVVRLRHAIIKGMVTYFRDITEQILPVIVL